MAPITKLELSHVTKEAIIIKRLLSLEISLENVFIFNLLSFVYLHQ